MTESKKGTTSINWLLIIAGVIIAIVLVVLLGWKITKFSFLGVEIVPPPTEGSGIQIANFSSGVLLFDSFSNSSFDGKYDTDLWSCFGCGEFGIVNATQGNGSIRLEATNNNKFENHSGGLVSQSSWLLNEIGYMEAKITLSPTDNGGTNILLRVPLEGKNEWSTSCWIQRFSATKAEYACDVFTYINGQFKGEYTTESFPVKYNEWHTAKIELTPNTFELRFFLDNKLIGQHVPLDVDVLKSKYLRASFGVYTDTKITAFIDSFVVEKAP